MFEPEPATEMIIIPGQIVDGPTDIITNLEAYTEASKIWNAYDGKEDLTTVKVFTGYKRGDEGLKAQYRVLDRHYFSHKVSEADDTVWMRIGHAYRVYIRYNRSNLTNTRQFVSVEIIDRNALTGPSGSAIKVGEIDLTAKG